MNQATTDRLNVKHPENTLHQKLRDEVGLCPAQADMALEIFLEHARINYDESRPAGQILRTVVSAVEPAGKPIKHCQTLEVRLTVDHRLDAEIQRLHGTVALRRAKVLRLCWEAYEQGGLLSYEDLAAILGLDQSSIQRMVKALRPVVGLVPTRGAMHDMGRAPSHKEPIGRLLCRGYCYTEITAMTGHSEGSIDRYALDLGRVIALAEQGAAPNDIRIICELSQTAVECYLRLYREHNTDEFRQHIDKLKRRFESGKGVVGPGQLLPRKPTVDPLERLQKRNYPCAVSRLLQQTLDLTGPVADLVADKIAALDAQVFADYKRLLPGQTILLVESADSAPKYSGHTAADRPLVPVVLSPWTPDKIDIWRSDRSPAEKRALIADGPDVRGAAPPYSVEIFGGMARHLRPRGAIPAQDEPPDTHDPDVLRPTPPHAHEMPRRAAEPLGPRRSIPMENRPLEANGPDIRGAAPPHTPEAISLGERVLPVPAGLCVNERNEQ